MTLVDAFAGLFFLIAIFVIILFGNDFLKDAHLAANYWQRWVTALGVTGACFFAVWQQSKVAEREAEQRRRKNFASRAVLPIFLNAICDYSKKCASEIARDREICTPGSAIRNLSFPELPVSHMQNIKECIESADEGPREHLADLLLKIQIQNSRLTLYDLRLGKILLGSETQFLFDCIEIYARCENLFPYARREAKADPMPPTKQQLLAAGRIMGLSEERLAQIVKKRYP